MGRLYHFLSQTGLGKETPMVLFSLSGWLKHLNRKSTGSRLQSRRACHGSHSGATKARFVPRLEPLEDRSLPSTFTVTNLHDSGPGSLRAAILAADAHPGPDVIQFAPELHGTIRLTSGELAITDSLAINGPGVLQITVSGNHASRVFDISGGPTVTVAGLTIANGLADHGGGILNGAGASLTVSQDTLSGNQAVGGLGGGGIFNDVGASLSVRDSSLTHNQATTTVNFTTGGGGGGAILNETGASLSVTHSQVSSNQAITTVGFDNFGGGIYNLGGTATIAGCTLANNQVSGGGTFDIIGGSAGGALSNEGGATVTVTDSSFSNNQAVSAAGGPYFAPGGAFDNDVGSTATVSNCQFTANQAIGPSGGASGFGGAIANENNGSTLSV